MNNESWQFFMVLNTGNFQTFYNYI